MLFYMALLAESGPFCSTCGSRNESFFAIDTGCPNFIKPGLSRVACISVARNRSLSLAILATSPRACSSSRRIAARSPFPSASPPAHSLPSASPAVRLGRRITPPALAVHGRCRAPPAIAAGPSRSSGPSFSIGGFSQSPTPAPGTQLLRLLPLLLPLLPPVEGLRSSGSPPDACAVPGRGRAGEDERCGEERCAPSCDGEPGQMGALPLNEWDDNIRLLVCAGAADWGRR